MAVSAGVGGHWRSLPFPLRAMGLFIVLILLSSLSRWLGAWSIVIAAALWFCAITGLLYASGRLRWIDRHLAFAGVLDRYAPRLGWHSAMPGAMPPTPGQPQPTPRPAPAPAVKIPDVSSFVGIDDVKEELTRLITSRVIQGAHLPATLIALIGPRGTGKSSMALHLASRLSKSGALSSDRIMMLSRETLPGIGDGGAGPEVMQAVTSQARAALGGVLLIEDLDWLPPASSGQTTPELGARLLDVARSNPRKLFMIATGSPEAFAQLDPDRRWLGQFNVISVSFPQLGDDALVEIFLQALKAEKLTFDPSARRTLELRIAAMKQESGAGFQNAYAMGQLVGAILARLPRDKHDVAAKDIRDADF